MTLPDLKAKFRTFCDGDDWGETMCWLFTIADELHFERATPVPDEWQFRPSPLGPSNDDDDFRTDCVREADDETLVRFGNLLTRYARLLRKHGKDY